MECDRIDICKGIGINKSSNWYECIACIAITVLKYILDDFSNIYLVSHDKIQQSMGSVHVAIVTVKGNE